MRTEQTQSMANRQYGDYVEAMALAELLRLGYTVSKPVSDFSKYDYIIEAGGRLQRVQVKSAKFDETTREVIIKARATTGRRSYKYTAADIDILLGVWYSSKHDEWQFTFVPSEELGRGRSEIRIKA